MRLLHAITGAFLVVALLTPAEAANPPGAGLLGGKLPLVEPFYGTAIRWQKTPAMAWRLAEESDKLVLAIQISGNFAKPDFT